jgi:ribulose-5-phosphate 4-epimerase/fuculose-1-phosphate aldolase
MNYATDFQSIRDQVSPEEWQTRLDLAACYRLVDKYEMTDLIYNHITARIPGPEEHLLINLYGLLYKEITASSSTLRATSSGSPTPTTASTSRAM